MTIINESKPLTKHVAWVCKCKFDCRKCNSNQKWNRDLCQFDCKNKKNIVYPSICACECDNIEIYIWSELVITCDEIVNMPQTVFRILMIKRQHMKWIITFCMLFLLETINELKEINSKNCTYYYFDDIFNINDFNAKNKKIDKKLYKNFFNFFIGYERLQLDGVKLLHINFNKLVEDDNRSKDLTIIPVD